MAELAGVTNRTLRHYHQIGLLPEPGRDGNGYRRYGVLHLVRLLRIKGLAAAGVPLNDIPDFLDGGDGATDERFDALDRQLRDQIAQLERQRQLVARLRGDGTQLDPSFRALSDGRSASANEAWREQITLFSHLLGQDDLDRISAHYARLADQPDAYLALGRRLDSLGADSSAAEIAALAADYVAHFRDLFIDFQAALAASGRRDLITLIEAHMMGRTNESQRKMMALVASAMGSPSG